MKKIIITMISLFMIMAFTSIASATNTPTGTTGGGDAVVLTDTGAGSGFTFNPSPSTVMSVYVITTTDLEGANFCLISASVKTTTENGIEYGIDSDSSDIYQRVQATDNIVTPTTSGLVLPTDFRDKANNAPPVS